MHVQPIAEPNLVWLPRPQADVYMPIQNEYPWTGYIGGINIRGWDLMILKYFNLSLVLNTNSSVVAHYRTDGYFQNPTTNPYGVIVTSPVYAQSPNPLTADQRNATVLQSIETQTLFET
jgi:hypothetical protein